MTGLVAQRKSVRLAGGRSVVRINPSPILDVYTNKKNY